MTKAYSQAELDALIATARLETVALIEDAKRAGADAERARIFAITSSDMFKGREAFAQKLIEMGTEEGDALELLAAAPAQVDESIAALPRNASAEAALRMFGVSAFASTTDQMPTEPASDPVATARAYNVARKGLK